MPASYPAGPRVLKALEKARARGAGL
ncbi:hypothetical protein SPIRO4BDMA_30048 [uncultured spirochete]|uniref:Uncharacterized protein n=1 Tax=uncultured spirochete TaxID=156406 RepID=A0A3P3XM89_9SPIR|nr:hypothetical protein SPIRO4BDMA_30048 [uncultured spirochete]